MMERSSAIAALQEWMKDSASVDRDGVRKLLTELGYAEETAADYPSVLLFYRKGWPRWTLMANNAAVEVEYRKQIARTMISMLEKEAPK
jgi:hypothetical protein